MPVASVVTLNILVSDIATVAAFFDRIKVYRSTDGGANFPELTAAATRIPIIPGKQTYEFTDASGASTYQYRVAYFHSSIGRESDASDVQAGSGSVNVGVLSIDELKSHYMFGVDLTDDAGNPFPDAMLQHYIDAAVDLVERELDVALLQKTYTEDLDYHLEDYAKYAWLQLSHSPVISVASVKAQYPTGTDLMTFPSNWIKLNKTQGQIQIVPAQGSLSQVLLGAGGAFLPMVFSGTAYLPGFFIVEYTAGFAAGAVPPILKHLVGMLGAIGPLNIAGDLIAGAGIASKSISMDGLSQSISTTSSATNAGYGARVIEYQKEIKEILPTLRRNLKGVRLRAM